VSRSDELYRRARRERPDDVAQLVAEDATWDGAEGTRWKRCTNRDQIVQTMMWRANALKLKPRETIELGSMDVVALRGRHLRTVGGRGFWSQQLFQVVTWRNGKVVSIRDYRRREEALAAAGVAR
jgi:ketosteroid isomerase-like protein